ncbi:DnaD and phage-associated domain-containing protein [Bacillus cereus VD196]|uniref:DnaD and phage-associated domain-containing protein n=2 Tax=Bacillus cereus group TaxID=86661 RepID=A0A9W5Q469_BACCE|nr:MULTISPECIES: DnaD domain protein [Bacillus cereus group]ADH08182.1 Phage replication protein [Bacillus thuringiensis BMB171]EOO67008.1 DnaD and phage-associated domain-containing protein [Bacillus cereus VD196]OTZ30479.1 DNA-binding protein [Bacillus thuringiensis serovar darmstadiensis]HDR6293518.1 DnaD domain protein [Bacillus cereus]
MGIIRVKKDSNYSVINNTGLKDERLSWKAKGILAYALTLPDDWTFHISELARHAKDGEDSLRTGFKELKELGYVKRYPVRDGNTKKITRWDTEIYETPQRDMPQMENQDVVKPYEENQKLLNTNRLNTNKRNNNDYDDMDKLESRVFINERVKVSCNFIKGMGIPLSEIAIAELGSFCNLFSGELIQHAINKAVDENAPRWNYIKAILRNWKEKEVKTLVDVAILDRRFEMSKKKKYNGTGRKYSNRKEIVPDWLYKDDESTNLEEERKTVQSTDEERERLQEVLNKYRS